MGNAKTPASPRSLKRLVMMRVREGIMTPWWMCRAYYDPMRGHFVMVAWPVCYLVRAWMMSMYRWNIYRHKPTWCDRVLDREMSALREVDMLRDTLSFERMFRQSAEHHNDKLTDEPASVTKTKKGN